VRALTTTGHPSTPMDFCWKSTRGFPRAVAHMARSFGFRWVRGTRFEGDPSLSYVRWRTDKGPPVWEIAKAGPECVSAVSGAM
jgi:hypothetical protein